MSARARASPTGPALRHQKPRASEARSRMGSSRAEDTTLAWVVMMRRLTGVPGSSAIVGISSAAVLLASLAVSPDPTAEDFWPQWRGPHATGVSKTADPPVAWSEAKNIRWKVEIPGRGFFVARCLGRSAVPADRHSGGRRGSVVAQAARRRPTTRRSPVRRHRAGPQNREDSVAANGA